MNPYFEKRKAHMEADLPNFGDGNSILSHLLETCNEVNPMNDGTIKADCNELYQLMNGMSLREMDKNISPVCKLCRDHEKSGIVEGVNVGMRLKDELSN